MEPPFKYTTRPHTVEAIQFRGDKESRDQIKKWLDDHPDPVPGTEPVYRSAFINYLETKTSGHAVLLFRQYRTDNRSVTLFPGDYIIREKDGFGFYRNQKDIFEHRYKLDGVEVS